MPKKGGRWKSFSCAFVARLLWSDQLGMRWWFCIFVAVVSDHNKELIKIICVFSWTQHSTCEWVVRWWLCSTSIWTRAHKSWSSEKKISTLIPRPLRHTCGGFRHLVQFSHLILIFLISFLLYVNGFNKFAFSSNAITSVESWFLWVEFESAEPEIFSFYMT